MVMKHIKLFENWAEEIEVPEYLDPEWEPEFGHSIFDIDFQKTLMNWNTKLYSYNFQHFYELEPYWRHDGYSDLKIEQEPCIYRLQDFEGLPKIESILNIRFTEIKSLKGLENRELEKFTLSFSNLENLKYCPIADEYNFKHNPLLSYYGINDRDILFFEDSLCGEETYKVKIFDMRNPNTVEFHAEQFCHFEDNIDDSSKANFKKFNPWKQCYYDPNDVENFEFLFLPFWQNSEKFREKAEKMIENLDMSVVVRGKESLW